MCGNILAEAMKIYVVHICSLHLNKRNGENISGRENNIIRFKIILYYFHLKKARKSRSI